MILMLMKSIKSKKAVRSTGPAWWHHIPVFKTLVICWLALLTIGGAMILQALNANQTSLNSFAVSDFNQLSRQNSLASYRQVVVNASDRQLVLPDLQLAFDHTDTKDELLYQTGGEGEQEYALLTSRGTVLRAHDVFAGQAAQAELEGRGFNSGDPDSLFDCQRVLELTFSPLQTTAKPQFSKQLADGRTLYVYAAYGTDNGERCEGKVWTPGQLSRYVDLIKTAKSYDYY